MPERARHIPKGNFSWVDQRLLFNGHLAQIRSPEALALYLFLVIAADAHGLSYYSDDKAAGLLAVDLTTFIEARRTLQQAGLIAYRRPLYQLLSLDAPLSKPRRRGSATVPQSVGDVLRSIVLNGESR